MRTFIACTSETLGCRACIIILALLAGPVWPALAAERLTIHHVGEYAAVPWTAEGARSPRVADLNLSVASINLNGDVGPAFLAGWAEHARIGAEQGKVFLPRVYFWDGNDRFEGPLRDTEIYWQRLDRFLAAMPLQAFHGIILAEENVAGGGRAEVLAELYRRIKAKYQIAVYQWWSPSGVVPTWNVPADGWVIDEYFLSGPRFRRIVQRYLVTGAPLLVMPYASWSTSEMPWPEATWQSLEDQLQVCREYNLPTAFFWTYNTGCHFDLGLNNFMDDINTRILTWTKQVQSLPADYAGLPSADISVGDLLEIAPLEDGKLVFRDAFDTTQFVEDADITGFRQLLWDESRTLAVRGADGGARASLTYRFAGDFPAHNIAAVVAVPYLATGSRVTLSISADGGRSWPRSVTTDGVSPQNLSLSTGSDRRFANCRAFRVRIAAEGDAHGGAPVVRLDDLQVSAELSVPTNRAITLKPTADAPDRLSYDDDFQTQKFRYSADVSQLDKIEWSRGSIAVRMQPGGAQPALIWKVQSPRRLTGITVRVDGKANRGSLGTNHYLDISADGRVWKHLASTEQFEMDASGWASHGLVIDTSGDRSFAGVKTFYVRLRQHAESYQQRHPYLSGIVNSLRIEAVTR